MIIMYKHHDVKTKVEFSQFFIIDSICKYK